MIKRVEVNYRGIFQKNSGKDRQRHRHDRQPHGPNCIFQRSLQRFSGRNGIPCKYFAFVSPDLAEEELEAECGAKLEIDEANISVVLDDTMCKGVEPWDGTACGRSMRGWSRTAACSWFPEKTGRAAQVHRQETYNYRLAILDGDASLAGLWVNKDDLTHERILGGIAAIDPA